MMKMKCLGDIAFTVKAAIVFEKKKRKKGERETARPDTGPGLISNVARRERTENITVKKHLNIASPAVAKDF